MEKRGLLEKIFGSLPWQRKTYSQLRVLSGYTPIFSPWEGQPYQANVVRAAVDAVARNAAKLRARHIRRIQNEIIPVSSEIERLLTLRPNPHMSAYDFFYRLITTLLLDNNAFAYPVWDGGRLVAIWPVNPIITEFAEDEKKAIYVKWHFLEGEPVVLPHSEVIHLRRHYYDNDVLGDTRKPINPILESIHTINQGLAQAVKTSASLRGIIKYQGILKDEDIKRNRERFVNEYLSIQNTGGVAALDAKADYIELKNQPTVVNAPQMKELRDAIYRYFGVNEKIVSGNYNEDEWNAFYEGTIEPLAVQMSQEFTAKLFSEREIGHGNEIIFESNRLQYASVTTKVAMVEKMMPMGLLTINEAREIFNLAPVEDGDKRLVSLNYVQADKQNLYQLGEDVQTVYG